MFASRVPASGVAAAGNATLAKHRKLVDAAQQFEAVFLQEMLKPMNLTGAEGSDGEAQNSTMTSFGTESVAKAIASAGGFGVARHIVQAVEGEQHHHEAARKVQT